MTTVQQLGSEGLGPWGGLTVWARGLTAGPHQFGQCQLCAQEGAHANHRQHCLRRKKQKKVISRIWTPENGATVSLGFLLKTYQKRNNLRKDRPTFVVSGVAVSSKMSSLP